MYQLARDKESSFSLKMLIKLEEIILGHSGLQNYYTGRPDGPVLYKVFRENCEGLQNLGLCLALRAFEQGGIFIMPHVL
jgi:hypothetical protein